MHRPEAVATLPATDPRSWWMRPGLEVRDGRLTVAGRDAQTLSRRLSTPLYVYDLERVREQVRALQTAYARAGLRYRVRLALKANREPAVLAAIRAFGEPGTLESVGIDACSPGEVEYALTHGFRPEEISHTGTNVSDRDLDALLAHPIRINVDLISQLERIGRKAPGRAVGIRVNPRAGAAWTGGGADASETLYSAKRPTKFGIFAERLDEAVAVARRHHLSIVTVHFHVGDGFLTDGIPAFEVAVERVAEMTRGLIDAGCPIEEVNTGGGLGVPVRAGEQPLDLESYAAVLARHLGPIGTTVAVEPGDFLVKESGILLAEVVTVEDRDGLTFVGLDMGWNVMSDRFIYHVPLELVPCRAADAPRTQTVTVAGHINEGDDLFAEDYSLPPVAEGDVLAIVCVGGYNQAMSMPHCLRPPARALFFDDRI